MPRKKTEPITPDEQEMTVPPLTDGPADCTEGDFPLPEGETDNVEDPSCEDALSAEQVPTEEQAMTEDAPDPEYEALLQEWSERDGPETIQAAEEPLILDPPSEEPEPGPETPAPEKIPSSVEAPMPPFPRPRRRSAASRVSAARRDDDRVLTIEAGDEVQTEADRLAAVWHEIQNADWTRRILTGTLDGIHDTPSGMTVAVVNYKGITIAIPLKEMLPQPREEYRGPAYQEYMDRVRSILQSRLNSEIDFVIKGHDNKAHSAVGSRRDAMLRKRQTFYLDKNESGVAMIHEGRVVQARVIAVSEKTVRVEVFGVECVILARGLSRAWVGDASEKYSVGDRILVRVNRITGTTAENLAIEADVAGASGREDNRLSQCVPQGRYAGRVTDVRNGTVFVRLNNGVNAIAHSCFDRRTPGKRDDVCFSVTRLDEEQGVAVGIITRIIKQNI